MISNDFMERKDLFIRGCSSHVWLTDGKSSVEGWGFGEKKNNKQKNIRRSKHNSSPVECREWRCWWGKPNAISHSPTMTGCHFISAQIRVYLCIPTYVYLILGLFFFSLANFHIFDRHSPHQARQGEMISQWSLWTSRRFSDKKMAEFNQNLASLGRNDPRDSCTPFQVSQFAG